MIVYRVSGRIAPDEPIFNNSTNYKTYAHEEDLLLTAIICLSIFTTKAQLANTKWQGTIGIPMQSGVQDFQATWDFGKDTLSISYSGGQLPTDVMTYNEQNKVVTVQKVSGGVPCDNSAIGKFSYEIKNDQLVITRISDECPARGAADISQPLSRVK